MKKYFYAVGCLLLATIGNAQTSLVNDQNPNYKISQDKYMGLKDSLQSNMNSTVQTTYKAYDWYQNKLDRRLERKELRRQVRMANANNCNDFWGYNNNYYGNNGYNNFSYGYNNWGNNNYGFRRNSFGNFLPNIGFNTGNWWFWL
jgi:hypothetical protein